MYSTAIQIASKQLHWLLFQVFWVQFSLEKKRENLHFCCFWIFVDSLYIPFVKFYVSINTSLAAEDQRGSPPMHHTGAKKSICQRRNFLVSNLEMLVWLLAPFQFDRNIHSSPDDLLCKRNCDQIISNQPQTGKQVWFKRIVTTEQPPSWPNLFCLLF